MRVPLITLSVVLFSASLTVRAPALDPAGAGGALGGATGGAAGGVGDAAQSVGGAAAGAVTGGAADTVSGAADKATDTTRDAAGAAGGAAGAAAGTLGATGGATGTVGTGGTGGTVGGAAGVDVGVATDAGRGSLGGSAGGAVGGAGAASGGSAVAPDSAAAGSGAAGRSPGGTPRGTPAVTGAVTPQGIIGTVVEAPVLITLPLVLLPDRGRGEATVERMIPRLGLVRGRESALRQLPRPLPRTGAVPRDAVNACRETIAAQARPHGAVRVEAASAGSPRRVRNGVTGAPIEARIVYARSNQLQVRQARVTCQLNVRNQVIALL